jgi:hypothetical protein
MIGAPGATRIGRLHLAEVPSYRAIRGQHAQRGVS